FLDYFPREVLHSSLSVADVHLISMRAEMAGIVVPGKLYGVMAAARPALFVGPAHCETADAIRESGCGETIRLGDAAGLVRAIEELAADPDRARALGERGRRAFLRAHDRDVCCESWSDLIRDLFAARRAERPAAAGQPLAGPSGSATAGAVSP
ncbi:MAG: glycosyltransferase WbuB, partial [Thermoleophilia bacterium]|nr:glycosyltransferase WbuB [Thermoleophilia bacterium]